MAFSRILDTDGYFSTHDDDHLQSPLGPNGSPPHAIQFQMPHFLNGDFPTVAVGGGVEVLTPGMFNSLSTSSTTPSWYNSSAYSKNSDDSFEKQYTTLSDSSPPAITFEYPPADPPPPPPKLYNNVQLPTSFQPTHHMVNSNTGTDAYHPHLYSGSGFDLMGVLARVVTRPNPKIQLGPVDLSTAFLVVDIRQMDSPIVYCSPTFLTLTGYEESEVRGRNCRFLQSPTGQIKQGEPRVYTDPEAVTFLRKSLVSHKECQTSLINYKKGGEAFVNLLTIIPISAHDSDEIVYHVGFQIDLTKQPLTILKNVHAGTYTTHFNQVLAAPISSSNAQAHNNRKPHVIPPAAISNTLSAMLQDIVRSLPLHTATVLQPSVDKLVEPHHESSQTLNLLLLEGTPDFIHVVSLKGSFLYVAPSVRGVLGFEPEELVGKSIADFCHPADIVPLMRELKESSVTPGGASEFPQAQQQQHNSSNPLSVPRTVDLLFRARNRHGEYVWVECRGRLHVEPGKGRKAIILSGRVRQMPTFQWDVVARAGGIAQQTVGDDGVPVSNDFWGTMSTQGTFLSAAAGVQDVFGWTADEIIGRTFTSFVALADPPREPMGPRRAIEDEIARVARSKTMDDPKKLFCTVLRKDGAFLNVQLVLFRPRDAMGSSSSSSLVYQVRILDVMQAQAPPVKLPLAHSRKASVFAELETARGSSWQYELQQLKFANQRLRNEIAQLEGGSVAQQPKAAAVVKQQQQQHVSPTPVYQQRRLSISHASPQAVEIQQPQPEWNTPMYYQTNTMNALKRSWDMSNTGS